jgi:type I restriction enzyme S subunit
MELKKGYKQTEIGALPDEWQLMPIDQIFEFHSTSNYSKAQMHSEGEIGCFHYGLIHSIPNSNYDISNGVKYFITKEQAKYEFIKEGDVVMVDASEDLSGVNKSIEISGVNEKLYISGLHTYLLRDKGYFEKNFKGPILNSYFTISQFYRLAVGMKVFGVSKQQLKTVLLPIPPKSEQTAIAHALSDADAYITSLEKLIEKKKAIKQGAMQELLKPKDEWKEKHLHELVKFHKGKGLPKSDIIENGLFKCIHYGELFTLYNESISTIISTTNDNQNRFLSKSNDILMPTSDVTPNGLAKACCIKEDNIILGGDILVIRPIENVLDGVFLSYYITANKSSVLKLVSGSTVYHLYASDMKHFKIFYPEFNEQIRIATILTEVEDEIIKLEKKLVKAKSIKQGMMQNLLTGKIRLI